MQETMGRGMMGRGGMGGQTPYGGQLGSLGVSRTNLGDEEEEAEMNLVELAVYGIASLYERYPPKPETATPVVAAPTTPK